MATLTSLTYSGRAHDPKLQLAKLLTLSLVKPSSNLQVIGLLSSTWGTLNNNTNAAITFRSGIFNDYFFNYERPVTGRDTGDSPTYR